ncbi:MAG: crossover junction endodeoxyribonuclease RuvC [Kiritimatiellae bacterium]|nr:crossover junction endodeoxyribonuclease RuvC [Kiritimatiellia bacterium]
MTKVLGVDTSLRSSGLAVVEARGSRLSAVEFGAVRVPRDEPRSSCLKRLRAAVVDAITRLSPDAAALEGIFYCKNVKTAVTLGECRGVVISVCAEAGIPVYEYPPKRIKQAVVGFGSAGKEQVRKMVMSILGLTAPPQEDASDALAIAICHLHQLTSYTALAPKEI